MKLIAFGTKEKHMAETKMNHDSSRSHTLFIFNLVKYKKDGKDLIASCRIVDLAGSERASRTLATGERFQEATAINSDLLHLMKNLRDLATFTGRTNYNTSYRDCTLTYLLSVSSHATRHE